MITPDYIRIMAHYNGWQNDSLYSAADTLEHDARVADQGAHFGSIQATLCHILWGDRMWMSRFAGTPKPEVGIPGSGTMIADWTELKLARNDFDATIRNWAETVDEAWLVDDMSWYSGAAGRDITAPRGLLVTHMFNHQTHHRGQVHAMLTAAGARPADTDLMLLALDPMLSR